MHPATANFSVAPAQPDDRTIDRRLSFSRSLGGDRLTQPGSSPSKVRQMKKIRFIRVSVRRKKHCCGLGLYYQIRNRLKAGTPTDPRLFARVAADPETHWFLTGRPRCTDSKETASRRTIAWRRNRRRTMHERRHNLKILTNSGRTANGNVERGGLARKSAGDTVERHARFGPR